MPDIYIKFRPYNIIQKGNYDLIFFFYQLTALQYRHHTYGRLLLILFIGEKAGSEIQKNGKTVPILMKNVKHVPDLYCNLFSISAALKEGCYLEGTLKMMKISKSEKMYVFDRHIKSGKGFLFAMKISNKDEQGPKKKERRSDLMKIHQEL